MELNVAMLDLLSVEGNGLMQCSQTCGGTCSAKTCGKTCWITG